MKKKGSSRAIHTHMYVDVRRRPGFDTAFPRVEALNGNFAHVYIKCIKTFPLKC